MSIETKAHEPKAHEPAETSTASKDIAKLIFVVPVATGAAVVVFGSLFLAVASPASGSFIFGAVASTVVGVLVGGFVVTTAFLVASVVTPWFNRMPDVLVK